MELSVSILNSENREETIKILNKSDTSYIHLDVMDGKFVSQHNLSIEEIKLFSKLSQKNLDIHLMVEDPVKYIEEIKELYNIEYITIHLEINKDIKSILSKIKEYGFKAGLSIKPNTKVDELIPYIEYLDLVLLMTVEPGLGGQTYILSSDNKLKELKDLTTNKIKIEVDGGINDTTIENVKTADIAVVGSYITKSEDPISRIKSLIV